MANGGRVSEPSNSRVSLCFFFARLCRGGNVCVLSAARGNLDLANKAANTTKKSIGEFMKKKEKPPQEMFDQKAKEEEEIKRLEELLKVLSAKRDDVIGQIGAPRPPRPPSCAHAAHAL